MAGILHKAGCCCETPCAECTDGDGTPKTLRVTFSGITLCPSCYNILTAGSVKWTTNPTVPVGPYILTQTAGNPCIWQYSESSNAVRTWYTDNACTAGAVNYNVSSLLVQVRMYSTAGPIRIINLDASWLIPGSPTSPENQLSTAFNQEQRSDLGTVDLCSGPFSAFSNGAACSRGAGADSGTGTVVAL